MKRNLYTPENWGKKTVSVMADRSVIKDGAEILVPVEGIPVNPKNPKDPKKPTLEEIYRMKSRERISLNLTSFKNKLKGGDKDSGTKA